MGLLVKRAFFYEMKELFIFALAILKVIFQREMQIRIFPVYREHRLYISAMIVFKENV